MKWSRQQEAALKAVSDWLKSDQQVFRLFGYAGTGKTTLAKHLAAGVEGQVNFCAYTGKAAQVLSTKGCPATTIHQLIYIPKFKSKEKLLQLQQKLLDANKVLTKMRNEENPPLEDIKLIKADIAQLERLITEEEDNGKRHSFILNLNSDLQYSKLIVVDECSMVNEQIGEDLLSFGKKVLVLGDPAQLPPVGGGGFFTDHTPDFMLTDIHRQAKDSPIIAMATDVRQGRPLLVGSYGNCHVHREGTNLTEIAKQADQMICGRNMTRKRANKRMRQFLGRTSELPTVGDRLVCLRNNHNHGLLNGQIWIAAGDAQALDSEKYFLDAYNEDYENSIQNLLIWSTEPAWYDRNEAEEFDYGYCLTCHKSQGSQWDHVLVMDESRMFRKDADRWLYTAITRAAERLDVIKL